MSTAGTLVPVSDPRMSANAGLLPPPWLSFSGRWPCVTTPCQSTFFANGSTPFTLGSLVYQSGSMMPITSYHDAREVSYIADTRGVPPLCPAPRQFGLVKVIDASHDTAPAG